jgi:hypothetical protein
LRTGKIIDKYLSQIISNRPGSKFFWTKLDFKICQTTKPIW